MIDIAELYRKKLQQQQEQQQKIRQQIDALENIVRQKLTKEALSRYGTLKSAHPERAIQLLTLLAQHISEFDVLDDAQLKTILGQMAPDKKEINIKRV